jgi:hypothetical protein
MVILHQVQHLEKVSCSNTYPNVSVYVIFYVCIGFGAVVAVMMSFGAHLISFIDRTLFLIACLKQTLVFKLYDWIRNCFTKQQRYQVVVMHEDDITEEEEQDSKVDDFWRLRSIMTHSAFKTFWQFSFIIILLLVGTFSFSYAEGWGFVDALYCKCDILF